MIEENKNSYLNRKISDELPQKYFNILSENFTELVHQVLFCERRIIKSIQSK